MHRFKWKIQWVWQMNIVMWPPPQHTSKHFHRVWVCLCSFAANLLFPPLASTSCHDNFVFSRIPFERSLYYLVLWVWYASLSKCIWGFVYVIACNLFLFDCWLVFHPMAFGTTRSFTHFVFSTCHVGSFQFLLYC